MGCLCLYLVTVIAVQSVPALLPDMSSDLSFHSKDCFGKLHVHYLHLSFPFLPSRLYFNLVIVAFCPHQTSSSPDVWVLEHQVISIKLAGLTLAHESSRGRTCCVHIQKGRAPWSLPAASRWWGCSLVMPWHLLRLTWFLDFTGSLSSFPSGKRQGLNPFSEYLVKIFVTFSFVCDTHVSQNLCSLLFYVHK